MGFGFLFSCVLGFGVRARAYRAPGLWSFRVQGFQFRVLFFLNGPSGFRE